MPTAAAPIRRVRGQRTRPGYGRVGRVGTRAGRHPGTVARVQRDRVAQAVLGVTAVTVAFGLVVQLAAVLEADPTTTRFTGGPARVFNMFCFFTVQSNVFVGVTSGLFALQPDRDSTWLRAFRLAAVVDIAITGIVYHVALRGLQELDGKALVGDIVLHSVVPVLAVLGWLLVGPRGLTSWPDVGRAAVIPVAWLAFTLVRGPIVHWYPYPFLDVEVHGYAVVFRNVALVAAVFLVFASGAHKLDEVLGRRSAGRSLAAA